MMETCNGGFVRATKRAKDTSEVLERSASMAEELFDPEFHSAMEQCKGIRVVYFDDERVHETMCDHEEKHNEKWRKELTPRRVETGTIAGHLLSRDGSLPDAVLIVRWDCGEEKLYSFIHGEWEKLRTLHLAAAGYLGSMVYCDVCQLPMLGFAFRCGSDQCSPQTEGGVLFDLCLHHYNGNEHFPDHPFRCFLPSGDITSTGRNLPPRCDPDRYQLLGMYPDAIVTGLTEPTQLEEGRVLRIVHDGGQDKIFKAEYWFCTAEVDTEPYSKEKHHPLQYQDAGKAGQCQLKVTEPAVGGPVYASHFPSIDFTLLKSMALYHKGLYRMDNGEKCYIRTKGPANTCWSISITWTELTDIDDSEKLWSLCHSKLEILNLTHNMLEMLPDQLVAFRSSLELLCVSYNCFSRIPEVVFKLTSLLHLNMFANQITQVPKDICKLSHLTSLFLGKNKIRSLPDVFYNLQELLEAGLEDNHLSELPHSFASLHKLKRVKLGYNQFTKIPDELFYLNRLESLHIEHNRIQRVSHPHIEILLSRLTSLSLAGNPLQHPAFLSCPDSEVMSLLRTHFNPSSRVSCRFRPSLRILVLGKSGSGKTSVVNAFHNREYVTPVEDLEYDHTVGINQYRIPFNMGGEVQELVLWDFAGQEEAAVSNEIFQSERTLIWLVVNLKAYERGSDESYSEHVGDWLDSLLTRISKPVVWVVATHTDEFEDDEDEVDKKCFNIGDRITDDCKEAAKSIDEKVETIKQQLKSSTLDLPSRTSLEKDLKHYHSLQAAGPKYLLENVKVLPLTNTHSFKGFDTLREHLQMLPADSAFQHLNDPLSEKWANATNAIRKNSNILLSSSKPPVVSLREVHESLQLIIPESTERDSLLEYLHQNGEIHVLSSDSATDGATVVLDVPWLIDILKHIFRHDFEKSVSKKYENYPRFRKRLHPDALKKALKENRANGVVKVSLLKALWLAEDVKEDTFKVIIGLLTKFGLAYESRKMDGYLFPWLLSAKACPDIPEHDLLQGSNHVSIRYSFAPHCKPKGLFARFIVLCRERVPTFDNVSRCSFEATLGNTCLRAVHACGKIEVHIYSVRGSAVGPTSYGKLWQILMELLKELEVLLQEWKGQQIDRYVLCPNCIEVPESDPELFQLEYMWPGPEYLEHHSQRCLSCATRTSARSCEIALEMIVPPKDFMVNAPDKVAEVPIETQHPVSNTARLGHRDHPSTPNFLGRLKNCHAPVTKEDCLKICGMVEMVQSEWPMFLTELGWTRADRDDVLHSPLMPKPTEKCFDILDRWIRHEGGGATVAALTKAVMATDMVSQWMDALQHFDRKHFP